MTLQPLRSHYFRAWTGSGVAVVPPLFLHSYMDTSHTRNELNLSLMICTRYGALSSIDPSTCPRIQSIAYVMKLSVFPYF